MRPARISSIVKEVTRFPALLISDPRDGVTFSKKPTVGCISMVQVTSLSRVSGSTIVKWRDVSLVSPPSSTTSGSFLLTAGG